MRHLCQIYITLLCIVLNTAAATEPLVVQKVQLVSQPPFTRLVLDTSTTVAEHRVFALKAPDRLVIDLPNAQLQGRLPLPATGDVLLGAIRSGIRDSTDLRIVLDLKQTVRIKSFLLPAHDHYQHRLVIELMPQPAGTPLTLANSAIQSATLTLPNQSSTSPPRLMQALLAQPFVPWRRDESAVTTKLRPVIIAIDAGHGGKDPGAIGAQGTQEKDVTLAIARRLQQLIDKEAGLRAVMIRDGDYFVALQQRIQLARHHRADLFVSIHADAFANPDVRGSSVFTLSEGGATSEAAKWLAVRENQADLVGGIDLGKSNEEVAGILIEMTQNLTLEHSTLAAERVLERLADLGDLHHPRVQSAGFAVLKAPDIPSLLVETAFISNPHEEMRLRDNAFQRRIAQSVFTGIRDYFQHYPPPQTLLTQQR